MSYYVWGHSFCEAILLPVRLAEVSQICNHIKRRYGQLYWDTRQTLQNIVATFGWSADESRVTSQNGGNDLTISS